MSKIAQIDQWLVRRPSGERRAGYRHQLLMEDPPNLTVIVAEVRGYFGRAYRDFIEHYRGLLYSKALCPYIDEDHSTADWLHPRHLSIEVLRGHFGEIVTGIVAEHYSPHGHDTWMVPAFLFRFHIVAFQKLEQWRQTGLQPEGPLPGRTGDDCLAFLRDGNGTIVKCLHCEAKCTTGHNADLVNEAHQQISDALIKDVPLLIEVLGDRGDEESKRWVEALRQFWIADMNASSIKNDMIVYVCGKDRVRGEGKPSWVTGEESHPAYTADRLLEVVEVHLNDVDVTVRRIYRKEEVA